MDDTRKKGQKEYRNGATLWVGILVWHNGSSEFSPTRSGAGTRNFCLGPTFSDRRDAPIQIIWV
jgi:hypothetical protein